MTALSIPKNAIGTKKIDKVRGGRILKFAVITTGLAGVILFSPAAARADIGVGMGFGMGGPRFHHEIIKIGPGARDALKQYLASDYKRQCTKSRNKPLICLDTKPLYIGSGLPTDATLPLPPDVVKKLGFIQPGTDYVRRGFVVYLISLPRRIILDTVTATDKSSNIQWNAP